jgi:hypothetical protein
MNSHTANNLRRWLRAQNLEGSETVPTAVLLAAIDEAPPADGFVCPNNPHPPIKLTRESVGPP